MKPSLPSSGGNRPIRAILKCWQVGGSVSPAYPRRAGAVSYQNGAVKISWEKGGWRSAASRQGARRHRVRLNARR